jgi:hypothetical protein
MLVCACEYVCVHAYVCRACMCVVRAGVYAFACVLRFVTCMRVRVRERT